MTRPHPSPNTAFLRSLIVGTLAVLMVVATLWAATATDQTILATVPLTTSEGVSEATNSLFSASGAVISPTANITPRLEGCTADATFVLDLTDGSLTPDCSRSTAPPTLTGNYEWAQTSAGRGLRLRNASGSGQLCIPTTKTWWRLGPDWRVRLLVQPNNWPTSGTLATVTSGWTLWTSGASLRLTVTKSPAGRSPYNHQWALAVQNRLVGSPHTVDLWSTTRGTHRESWVLLDGELRAPLLDEVLNQAPGSSGKLCVGSSTWDVTVLGIEIHNGTFTRNQTTYASPTPRTIYPGRIQLSPVAITPGRQLTLSATVTEPSPGTRVYLEPRYYRGTELTKPLLRPAVSFVQMACGVGRNHSFYENGAQSFRRHNGTFSCVISNAGFNTTATDDLATWGVDLGLEYDPNKCDGIASARQNWLLNRGHYPYTFVNYFGILAEAGLSCAAQYGFAFTNALANDNAQFFRPTLRHAACDYKSDALACFVEGFRKSVAENTWVIVSSHWGAKANDTLYESFMTEAERLGLRVESVREVQRTRFPELGHGPITHDPPPDATAFVPVLYLYSDGTQTPTIRDITIAQTGSS